MKKTNLLKSMLLLCALVAGSGSVWAQSWSYEFVEADKTTSDLTSSGITKGGVTWSFEGTTVASGSPVVNVVKASISGTAYYWLKFGSSSSAYFNPVILSTTAFNSYKVTKVNLHLKHNGAKVGKLTVKQGDITIGTATTESTSNAINVTCSQTNKGNGGTLEIKYEVAQALSINKIEVWYEKPVTFAAGKTMISFSDATNALDLTTANLPSGLAAYKVSAATASAVTLTAVNSTVEANTGVILTGTASTTYNIPVVATGTDISASNLLVASDGTSNVTDAYVLSSGKFHPVQDAGIVIPAGKAYLPAGSLTAHELDIEFDNGNVTGIQSVENQKTLLDGAFYNLAGQRVVQPTKGMYIVNGKKVVIK